MVVVAVEVRMLIVDQQVEDLVEQVEVELELRLLDQDQMEQITLVVEAVVVEMEMVHYLLVEMVVRVW
tara:strand:+ start:659 stop:862 length:204 start_codon:yes stop_codon:yes gene_type:complete